MAKNKKKKKKTWKHIKVEVETTTAQRQKFPEKLIKTFDALKKSDWGEKEYKRYIKEVKKYMGDKFEDRLEQGKLLVLLSKATTDL